MPLTRRRHWSAVKILARAFGVTALVSGALLALTGSGVFDFAVGGFLAVLGLAFVFVKPYGSGVPETQSARGGTSSSGDGDPPRA